MAEETQGIQNKWLLLIAVVLGVIVVLIYNAHIRAIRAEQKGKTVAIIQVNKDLKLGEKITARHIKMEEIPHGSEKAFGKVLKWEDRNFVLALGGRRVNQPVMKGQYLLWDHVMDYSGSRASGKLGDGMVAIPIEFDSDKSLGDILSVGDTVNLKGVFDLKGGQYKTYRIISGVRVMNVGGRGAAGGAGAGRGRTGMKSYRRITIEVSPKVSLELSNLMTHMHGDIQLELNQASTRLPPNAGEINPLLEPLTAKARPITRGKARGVMMPVAP